jgi:hypothetical protein
MSLNLHCRSITLTLAALTCGLALTLVPSAAMAKRYQHTRVYVGYGTISAVDAENDTLTADLTSANRALRNALGGNLSGVTIAVDENTAFSLDGEDAADLSDVCSDDTVRFVIRTPDKLSGSDLSGHPAQVVAVSSASSGECDDQL